MFMCPGNIGTPFEENLKGLEGWKNKKNIMKIILKFNKTKIIEARERLYDLNITRATLFPGLGGFAESLKVYPPKTLIGSAGLRNNSWLKK